MNSSSNHLDLIEELADDFASRQRQGENPSMEDYISRYPNLASEIREIFPALVMMEQVAPETGDLRGSETAVDRQPLLRQVGEYRILRELGRGGMGVVYEAEQESLQRRVALKILPRELAASPNSMARFKREARAAARMHHTNIVPVFEVGQEGDVAFYTMQLIQGQGLNTVIHELRRLRHERSSGGPTGQPEYSIAASLRRGAFQHEDLGQSIEQAASSSSAVRFPDESAYTETIDQMAVVSSSANLPGESEISTAESNHRRFHQSVGRLGIQIADALSYAHARGIIHRDIKPSNLILDAGGVVWVTDFGLAKVDDEGMTHTGDILGTMRYMSPERFRGRCDVRADIYSLGLTLYELLVLQPAFDSLDRLKLIELVRDCEPTKPRSMDPRIPRDLETIILKSIDKDPRQRYQSADELSEDLHRFVCDEPIRARRVSALERGLRWSRRNKTIAASVFVVAMLLIAVAIGSGIAATHFKKLEQVAQKRAENLRLSESELRENESQLKRRLYAATIPKVQSAIRENNHGFARQLLEECPEELRGWEWRHLHWLSRPRHLLAVPGRGELTPEGHVFWGSGMHEKAIRTWNVDSGELEMEYPIYSGSYIQLGDGSRVARISSDFRYRISDAISSERTGEFDLELTDISTGKRLWSVPLGTQAAGPKFSCDSKLVLTVSIADRVRSIWDTATGDRLENFIFLDGIMSPDFHRTLSDGVVIDTQSATKLVELNELAIASKEFVSHEWSPDGSKLVGPGRGQKLRVWDTNTGTIIEEFSGGQRGPIRDITWSSDCKQIATLSQDKGVRIIDLESKTERKHQLIGTHDTSNVWWIHSTPDSTRASSFGVETFHPPSNQSWDPNNTFRLARVWQSEPIDAFPSLPGAYQALAISPRDGEFIATARSDGAVCIWEVATRRELFTLQGKYPIAHLEYHPNGRWLLSAGGDVIQLWDIPTKQVLATLPDNPGIHAFSLSPDGKFLATGNDREANVRVWEVESLTSDSKPKYDFEGTYGILQIEWSPDSHSFAVDGRRSAGSGLTIRAAATGEVVREESRSFGWMLAYSPDGRQIACGSNAQVVTILDSNSGHVVSQWKSASGFSQLKFLDNGRLLVGNMGELTLCDATHGDELLRLEADTIDWMNFSISPDRRMIAACSRNGGPIRLWESGPASVRDQQDLRRAQKIVDQLVEKLSFTRPVLKALQAQNTLNSAVREMAVNIVKSRIEYAHELQWANVLDDDSMSVVMNSDKDGAEYEEALGKSEIACRILPESAIYRTTLGIAQYRVGQLDLALNSLKQAEIKFAEMHPDRDHPPLLAFKAMTLFRMGRDLEAQEILERLEKWFVDDRWGGSYQVYVQFLRETEDLFLESTSNYSGRN